MSNVSPELYATLHRLRTRIRWVSIIKSWAYLTLTMAGFTWIYLIPSEEPPATWLDNLCWFMTWLLIGREVVNACYALAIGWVTKEQGADLDSPIRAKQREAHQLHIDLSVATLARSPWDQLFFYTTALLDLTAFLLLVAGGWFFSGAVHGLAVSIPYHRMRIYREAMWPYLQTYGDRLEQIMLDPPPPKPQPTETLRRLRPLQFDSNPYESPTD